MAGLIDPREQLSPQFAKDQKELAIQFVAALPEVFGEELDRMKMWDRIGTAIQTACAKTPGADHEFFISRVLEVIKASPASVARNHRLAVILESLGNCPPEAVQSWLAYMGTHLYAVLVHAKAEWEVVKSDRKAERESSDE